MAGTRQTLAVIEGKGAKHLTKKEKAARVAAEVSVAAPKKISPPTWLPEDLRGDFRKLSKEILTANMGGASLDRDTIGRYLVAQTQFAAATRMVRDALDQEDADAVSAWSTVQEKYFKQARACAMDMGMTITSRCRLVLPQGVGAQVEDNPFEVMLRERMRRA